MPSLAKVSLCPSAPPSLRKRSNSPKSTLAQALCLTCSPGQERYRFTTQAGTSTLILATRTLLKDTEDQKKPKPTMTSYYSPIGVGPEHWEHSTHATHLLSQKRAEYSRELGIACLACGPVLCSLWYSYEITSTVHSQGSSKVAILTFSASCHPPLHHVYLPTNTWQTYCTFFH